MRPYEELPSLGCQLVLYKGLVELATQALYRHGSGPKLRDGRIEYDELKGHEKAYNAFAGIQREKQWFVNGNQTTLLHP